MISSAVLCTALLSQLFSHSTFLLFFFFNDTATTETYTLSLHDALPISHPRPPHRHLPALRGPGGRGRSEEHTSELQSQSNLVCRLLLEKKKNTQTVSVRLMFCFLFLISPQRHLRLPALRSCIPRQNIHR